MNRNIIYYTESGDIRNEDLPWDIDFGSRGIVVLTARTTQELFSYCKAYLPILITIDIDSCQQNPGEFIREIQACRVDDVWQPPVLGYSSSRLDPEECTEWASHGLDDLMMADEPQVFRIWQLEMLISLFNLSEYREKQINVADLADQTREGLHNLSQPLSAIQGRLQLLAAKAGPDDPNDEIYRELVKMVMEVSKHLMHLQQVQRNFS